MKYLGLWLDSKRAIWGQIQSSRDNAAKVPTTLSKLMANVGGATLYRILSEPVVLMITGVTPIDLLAQEKKRVYGSRKEVGTRQTRTDAKAG